MTQHASSCAVHNMPAYPAGPCDCGADAASATIKSGQRLWLWKNGDHFLAFDQEYPTFDGGDPMVLGEPVGIAEFIVSQAPEDN